MQAKDSIEPPKKPLSTYFKFKGKLMEEFKKQGEKLNNAVTKQRWDNLSEA